MKLIIAVFLLNISLLCDVIAREILPNDKVQISFKRSLPTLTGARNISGSELQYTFRGGRLVGFADPEATADSNGKVNCNFYYPYRTASHLKLPTLDFRVTDVAAISGERGLSSLVNRRVLNTYRNLFNLKTPKSTIFVTMSDSSSGATLVCNKLGSPSNGEITVREIQNALGGIASLSHTNSTSANVANSSRDGNSEKSKKTSSTSGRSSGSTKE